MCLGSIKTSKKFLVLNPSERGTSEDILRDSWAKVGHEEELKLH
jgi:hypothetical protein